MVITVADADIPLHVLWSKRNWLIVPLHPPAGQVHTKPPAAGKLNPDTRWSLAELPVGNPNVVPLVVTVHVAPVAQMSVIPFDSEKVIVALHEYEPLANVTTAPSEADPTTVCICAAVVPDVHDQDVPVPEHVA
jgi:hypothetical protein